MKISLNLKKCLSEVKWSEVLDQIDPNNDYNMFVKKFQEIHDQCIPLKKCTSKYKKDPKYPCISKGLLKSIKIIKTNYKTIMIAVPATPSTKNNSKHT